MANIVIYYNEEIWRLAKIIFDSGNVSRETFPGTKCFARDISIGDNCYFKATTIKGEEYSAQR